MPKRDLKLYVFDILDSINAIETYINDVNNFSEFQNDRKTYSATIREYLIIGEAIPHLIKLLEERYPDYDWRIIKDFRNFLVHEYFGVDLQIIWDVTKFELKELKSRISDLKNNI